MQFIKKGTSIDFMGKRRAAMVLSGLAMLIGIVAIAVRGLNFGIDFTGGTLVEVNYAKAVPLEEVRAALADGGFGDDATVQSFGTPRDLLIRLAPQEKTAGNQVGEQVAQALDKATPGNVQVRRVEFVGPQVGDELAEEGALAVLVALMAILIYVAMRFEWRFALGSVIALVHDVTITVGLFALLQLPFDLPVLAAVLAVIGYSLNDTIVVYDRVRENFRKMRKGSAEQIINTSLVQTLSRTLMTSGTTLMVLVALYLLGGEIIHGFAFALLVGVVVGTYSSIYVASTAALMLGVSKADLMAVKKEGVVVDDRP